jgi:hypothetical protein
MTHEVLELSDFEPLIHQTLMIQFTPEVALPATLVEVSAIKSYTPAERTPFKLVFRTAQKNEYFNQAIFGVKHPDKGELAIFLVPTGPDAEGMLYEAVFS